MKSALPQPRGDGETSLGGSPFQTTLFSRGKPSGDALVPIGAGAALRVLCLD